ncbi:hypothetical protein LTR95_000937 [Oleoguttula sp. CCFEE 5521]
MAPESTTPAGVPDMIDPDILIEEETTEAYKPKNWYPVQLGEVFNDRYKVVGKLGYGSSSTIWLCRDLQTDDDYVVVKVYVNNSKWQREIPIYEHMSGLNSKHTGLRRVRKMLDSFELLRPGVRHFCLVHEALGLDLDDIRRWMHQVNADFTQKILCELLQDVLQAMHFLHIEAHVIHTGNALAVATTTALICGSADIQPKNILMSPLDNKPFKRLEDEEAREPLPRKILDDRTIYLTRPVQVTAGAPKLCDLGEARFADHRHADMIMPEIYRAPEVILGLSWSYPVDIWAFAMTLWDLLQPKRLFHPYDEGGRYSECIHLAQMSAIMGPPPVDFLRNSKKKDLYWDNEGQWKGPIAIPDMGLEIEDKKFEGEEQRLFLQLMRKMLKWEPDARCSIQEILDDEWFTADLESVEEAE